MSSVTPASLSTKAIAGHVPAVFGRRAFWRGKRVFDLCLSLFALPIIAFVGAWLLILNPLLNRGPLFYKQLRMGRDQTEFTMLKFRTMAPSESIERGPGDPVEVHRITPLGHWLRRLRIDELPQILNVLRGDMSLIGPRPDYIEFARNYSETIPSYRHRHVVRPGISGYAQVRLGYTEGYEHAETKAQLDMYYIQNAGWRLETWILAKTVAVVFSGQGAR